MLKRVPHLYQIERAVGVDCPNKLDDVMLIQFMLNTWLYFSPLTGGKEAGKSIWGDVPQHGTCDIPTRGFLIMFQLFSREKGTANGQIEPMDLSNVLARGGFLANLNGLILVNRPDVFRDFSVAPGVPAALISHLKGFD